MKPVEMPHESNEITMNRAGRQGKISLRGRARSSLLFFALFVWACRSMAQTSIEFVPSGGYTFADRVNFYNNFGKIDGAGNLGGSFVFNFNRIFGLELMYNHMSTVSGLYQYNGSGQGAVATQGNLGLDYILAGPVQTFNIPNSPVRPFIGAMLGASLFSPGVDGVSTDAHFAWGAQLGTNIYFNPRFGLRLQARLLSSDASGSGFYMGKDGSGQPISAYSDVYQFSLNAGLVIGLGRELAPLRPVQHIYRRPGYRRRFAPYPY